MAFPQEFLIQLAQSQKLSERQQEVFVELFGTGQSRVAIQQKLNISNSSFTSCLTEIYRKFSIADDTGKGKENHLRDYLENQYKIWKPKAETTATEVEPDLRTVVQTIRAQIQLQIHEQCGTMRVLDMTQPIALTGEQGIYTNVNILEKLTGRRRLELPELLQQSDLENFDRFGLSRRIEQRVPGLEAAQRYPKLMVLGKPGAGKTTFLKYLAMQCITGNFLADHVPIFVTLKQFAETKGEPSLIDYLNHLIPPTPLQKGGFEDNRSTSAAQTAGSVPPFPRGARGDLHSVLNAGKALILLDGLDEVREEDIRRVIGQIEQCATRFPANQFVIICRIAAKEYTFGAFTEVEVADFDDAQIQTFAGNWFRAKGDAERAELFWQKLKENKRIKELATSPLLLTLLCLMFEDTTSFPANRAELYKEGLDVLLKKWDGKRKIERDVVYKNLSLKRKEDMLSQIALTTFANKEYFFKQRHLEDYITEFIRNLPDAQTDPEALHLDSEAVLKSIEAHHGLLIERAKGIYSFSHLTFHEYFAAREIAESRDPDVLQRLATHVTEKRWREVFFLTAGMMRNADDLMQAMKQEIDELLKDNLLQNFLKWVYQKGASVDSSYNLAAIRAFYFELSFSVPERYCPDIALSFGNNLSSNLNLQFDAALDSNPIDLSVDYCLVANLTHVLIGNFDSDLIVPPFDFNIALKLALEQMERQIPNWRDEVFYEQWELKNSQGWTEQLRAVMIEHRNIGHDWQFSDEQKELLKQYYDANKLLVDCLNSGYVSREVSAEIEETLLLPMSEIEKRRK